MAACLVDQPTFTELGMNDAWNVQARLNKLEQDQNNEHDNNPDNDDEHKSDEDNNKEEDDANKKETQLEKNKFKKRLSIASTPSFHTQDLHRIYSIHTDLVETTLAAKIQSTISEATTEFEKANAISQELFNRKLKYETDLQNLQSVPIQAAIQNKQQVAMEFAMAKNNFIREAKVVDTQFQKIVCASALSNILDRVSLRFAHVQRYNDYNFIRSTVGSHLNKMVQNVTYQAETSKQYSQFVPSQQLMEAAAAVQNQDTSIPAEQELLYKNKIQEVQNLLRVAEEDRRKAWKKLQKVKADLLSFPSDAAAAQANAVVQKARVAQQQVRTTPTVATTTNIIPQTLNNVQVLQNQITNAVTTTTQQQQILLQAQPQQGQGQGQNDPNNVKYSAESVRARCYPDGSIMPVSLPKQNKDGLFQRPAGRKRKGMDWDAVRGRWMPASGFIEDD